MKSSIFFLLVCFLTQACIAQSIQKIVLNAADDRSGCYWVVEPQAEPIGVLVLLAGFGQYAESIFPETKLHNVAYANNILTVAFAAGDKLYADEEVQTKLTAVLNDVLKRYNVDRKHFVIGGFSAGGMVALRYTELCKEFPDRFPAQPQGVFMVDSPIDIFTVWNDLEEIAKTNYSEPAVEEAVRAMEHIRNDHGVPRENVKYYSEINSFSMDPKLGTPEKFLKNTAVRAYHDVDIAWRLRNRNQPVRMGNYYVTSELINRLLLMGNERAEFMQSYQTGYRSNGMRHPHSWSIVEEVECVMWMKGLWN